MEGFKVFQVIAILAAVSVISVNGQISTSCTASMISSFTPCLNFITGSTSNGSSPTQGCCGAVKSLMSGSMDCACLIITANVPFQLPINRTLALGLPRACNMGGVPVQCKGSGTPLPAPGPVPFLLPPTLPPTAASPLSPRASKASAEGPASESDTPLDLIPASAPGDEDEPEAPSATINPGIRPVVQPSASNPSYISPPSLLILLIGITIFKLY
ncbi:Bifunctional inhibitor/plant lipid transfer protein/seed storage helical domain - like 9 [Theobroma cacao]|nr:Bifunctional inhibitor/plant lipid transfer protein/seed storage helical domain - like 9 [Theobroma cacao]